MLPLRITENIINLKIDITTGSCFHRLVFSLRISYSISGNITTLKSYSRHINTTVCKQYAKSVNKGQCLF